MKNTKIKKNRESLERDAEESTENQFELLSKLPRIHGVDLKKNISADYTLAKLNEDERIYVKDTYENAGFLKFIIEKIANDSGEYQWVPEKKDWIRASDNQYKKIPINDDTRDLINAYNEYLFKSLMLSPDILVILRRNDEMNFLLRLLGDVKIVDEHGQEQFGEPNESMIERLKERLNNQS